MNFQPGGESGVLIKSRKQAVVAVRLLVFVILALLVVNNPSGVRLSHGFYLIAGVFVLSHVLFWFVNRSRFESSRSYALILIFDVGAVVIFMSYLEVPKIEFLTVFMLTVLAAAVVRKISIALLLALLGEGIYILLKVFSSSPKEMLTQGFLLRVTLLIVMALLAAYISEALDAERRIAIHLNPTTGLPGYSIIRNELEKRIASGNKFAVCYIDNDNFKAYNDYYGYASGDSLIKATGRVITEAVTKTGGRDDFVGHIGGDDFLVITTPDRIKKLAQEIKSNFAVVIEKFYDEAALEAGFIRSKDRKGVTAVFPLMSLSLAVVSNEYREIRDPDQIARTAAELKKKAKSHKSRMFVTGDTTIQYTYEDIEAEMEKRKSSRKKRSRT